MKPILLKEIIGRAQFDQFEKTVLAEKCPVSLAGRQDEVHLFRGSDRQTDYTRYDPTARIRSARDSNNFSLLFTETLDSWKDAKVPFRRKSVIFTPDKSSARDYGENHLIFFEGDPIIAYGTAGDNYNNYGAGYDKAGLTKIDIHSVETLDDTVNRLFSYFITYHDAFADYDRFYLSEETDPEGIAKLVVLMENEASKINADIFQQYIDGMWGVTMKERTAGLLKLITSQGLVDTLAAAYDPGYNGIVVQPLSKYFQSPKQHVEIWSSGAYYLTPLYLSLNSEPDEYGPDIKI